MRLSVKANESEEAKLVSRIFLDAARNITTFGVVELVLGDSDEISVSDACAKISIDMRNDFIQEQDEKAIKFIVAQKTAVANMKRLEIGESVIEEILANKMLAKAGYGDALVYYYYSLISKMNRNIGFEEFILLNIPWLSLYGIDDYDAKFFLELIPRFNYKKSYELTTKELFSLLKGKLQGQDVVKAVRLYRGLYANNQI